jgi:hypothetical protein
MDPRASFGSAGDGAGRLHGLALRQPLARFGNDARYRGVVDRRHDVNAGDARDGRQFLDQIHGDAFTFGRGIGGALEPFDIFLGDDGAVEMLLHPAR